MFVSAWPSEVVARLRRPRRQRAVGTCLHSVRWTCDGRTPTHADRGERLHARSRLPRGERAWASMRCSSTRPAASPAATASTWRSRLRGAALDHGRDTGRREGLSVATGRSRSLTSTDASGDRARLDWLPQETILFDRRAACAALECGHGGDGVPQLFEAVVFGRAARWARAMRGRRCSRIAGGSGASGRAGLRRYAAARRARSPICCRSPACGNGARAIATLIHVAPDAEARLEAVRAHACLRRRLRGGRQRLERPPGRALLRRTIEALRVAATALSSSPFAAQPLPRVWLS